MNIYLDTMLWNVLCDQNVDAEKLGARLAASDAQFVLSGHTVYELAKTFRSGGPVASERGCQLFSYLKIFVDAGTLCAKDNMELLTAEMDALVSHKTTIETFISAANRDRLRLEVDKLSNGEFDEQAKVFVESRRDFATSTRRGQSQHLSSRTDTREKLRGVRADQLETWLGAETATPGGAAMLAGHIERAFTDAPRLGVVTMALDLLSWPYSR
ncbi:MAG: hypothetical protein WAL75_21405, partial [Terracidiphilus sp.]